MSNQVDEHESIEVQQPRGVKAAVAALALLVLTSGAALFALQACAENTPPATPPTTPEPSAVPPASSTPPPIPPPQTPHPVT